MYEKEIYIIGEFLTDEKLYQEEVVGVFKSTKSSKDLGRNTALIVDVRPKERSSTKHFHIYSKDRKFNASFEIFRSKYFDHDIYVDTFSSQNLKRFNEWLDEKNVDNKQITNWQAIAYHWATNRRYEYSKDEYARMIRCIDNNIRPNYTESTSRDVKDNKLEVYKK